MTKKAVPGAILLLVLALVAGCTVPGGGGGGGTPTPTRTPATLPVTPVATVTPVVTVPPGPVVTVPPNYDIQIQVTRNPNTAFPYITVAFRGGYGQIYLQELTATVARSDGLVIREVVPKSGGTQYAVGDSVNIDGTTGTDEVVVVATLLGVDYKIYDEFLPFYTVQPPP